MTLVDKFLNKLKSDGKSPDTIKSYGHDLKLWLQFQFPNMGEVTPAQLEAVTPEQFYAYLDHIANKSANTRSRATSSIKAFYNYLVDFKLIASSPARAMKKTKVEKRLPKFLIEKQCIKLLESVEKKGLYKERDYAILTLFMNTGIRESELINLNLDSIKEDVMTVVGKGNKERSIPLNTACIDALKEYIRVREKSESNALFLTRNGERFSATGLMYAMNVYLKKFNISIHKLRHTAATLWLSSGADLAYIKYLMGHESFETTLKYTHTTLDGKQKVVNNSPLANIKRKKILQN